MHVYMYRRQIMWVTQPCGEILHIVYRISHMNVSHRISTLVNSSQEQSQLYVENLSHNTRTQGRLLKLSVEETKESIYLSLM